MKIIDELYLSQVYNLYCRFARTSFTIEFLYRFRLDETWEEFEVKYCMIVEICVHHVKDVREIEH